MNVWWGASWEPTSIHKCGMTFDYVPEKVLVIILTYNKIDIFNHIWRENNYSSNNTEISLYKTVIRIKLETVVFNEYLFKNPAWWNVLSIALDISAFEIADTLAHLAQDCNYTHKWIFHHFSDDSPHKGPIMWKAFLCHGVIKPVLFFTLFISWQITLAAWKLLTSGVNE